MHFVFVLLLMLCPASLWAAPVQVTLFPDSAQVKEVTAIAAERTDDGFSSARLTLPGQADPATLSFAGLSGVVIADLTWTRRQERNQVDFNGHANNITYIDWSLDDVPHEIYEGYRITDVRVEYKKECLPGALVETRCYVRDLAHDRKEILSLFTNAAGGEPVHGIVSTIWQRP